MPDRNLVEAAVQIQAILKKHDIAGVVHLASKSHTHFLIEVSPSWSCATVENNGIRVRALRKDFPTHQAQKETLDHTVGMFMGLHSALIHTSEQLMNLIKTIGKLVGEISHWDRLE